MLQLRYAALILLLIFATACDEVLPPTPTLAPATATLSAAQVDATSGARVQPTKRAEATQAAQATAAAQAQATADAMATAEEVAHRATQAAAFQATAQALQTAQANWPVLLQEDFSTNTLDWPVGLKSDGSLAVTTLITNSQYVWLVNVADGNSYFNFVPTHSPVVTDFYAAVDVQFLAEADAGQYAYGLTWRQVGDDYGFCGVQSNGRLRMLAVFDTGIYQLIAIRHPAIRTGRNATNRIAVRALDNHFVCLVNDQPAWAFSEDFAPGAVGLGVDTLRASGPGQVAFSNLVIYAPPAQP